MGIRNVEIDAILFIETALVCMYDASAAELGVDIHSKMAMICYDDCHG